MSGTREPCDNQNQVKLKSRAEVARNLRAHIDSHTGTSNPTHEVAMIKIYKLRDEQDSLEDIITSMCAHEGWGCRTIIGPEVLPKSSGKAFCCVEIDGVVLYHLPSILDHILKTQFFRCA